jgi:hypothetical protein
MSHGIATLSAAGQIPREKGLEPETLLRNGVLAIIRGAATASDGAGRAATRTSKSRR